MIDYTCNAHKCVAQKMPRMSDIWPHTPEQAGFITFITSRLGEANIFYECKALFIRIGMESHRIMSGQYLVFRDDGKISVMFPSSFHDVWTKDAA